MASNSMPRCKYGLACRIIDPKVEGTANGPLSGQHWFKFQHPCYWVCKEGHPELGPPGVMCPLDPKLGPPCMAGMIVPCTNFDPEHRRCFRHPEDDVVKEEVVDESIDEFDSGVTASLPWTPAELGEVSEEEAMEAKMAAAEAMGNGEFAAAAAAYSKALVAMPSALAYAKRAEALLRLGHLDAAAADCDKALEMNPDSAKAYKVSARAAVKLGYFQKAFQQLCVGNKIDYDEDSAALQKALKAKCDKMKKIADKKAKEAEAAATPVD